MFLFLFLCLFVNNLYSQKDLDWLPDWERSILDSLMNLNYIHQEGYLCDSTVIHLNYELGASPKFHIESADGHFFTAFDVMPPFTKEDSIRFSDFPDPLLLDRINKEHIIRARALVAKFYGEKKSKDYWINSNKWKNYVDYLVEDDIKIKLNADTVLYIDLPYWESDFYAKSYPYCSVLILQKQDRGCLPLFFLYDEEGKKDINAHMVAMVNSFRYGDEAPLKKKLDNEDIKVFFFNPKQPKVKIIR